MMSLPLYWNWQYFHAIMAVLIDSNFLLQHRTSRNQLKKFHWTQFWQEVPTRLLQGLGEDRRFLRVEVYSWVNWGICTCCC